MSLGGYGGLIWAGTLQTIELSLLSLVVSFVIGLVGACAKLSKSLVLSSIATVYTTLIRGIPDLVLMLLIFYGIQIWLNDITDWLNLDEIDLDPFVAGVITLGFIYGAYFTETFRGAFLAVPKNQTEAALSCGMRPWLVFRLVLFPQLMHYALPGLSNNWQVILKATALVSILGLSDVVKATQDAGKATYETFFFTLLAGAIYLALTVASNGVVAWLDRRFAVGMR